jgi:peroxisomal 3,2-trans-enoyl-CoA isomerase
MNSLATRQLARFAMPGTSLQLKATLFSRNIPTALQVTLRSFSDATSKDTTKTETDAQIITSLTKDGIFTLQMNRPKTLNAWTEKMMKELASHFTHATTDESIKVLILTGTGKYYCAGVNLAGILKPMHPAKLHGLIKQKNQQLFELFLNFPKPIIAAVNGPAIGASVTSAVLCDAIVASEKATFSTPFARLGVPAEGCSSVHFEQIMGKEKAERMLGEEGWTPTAQEAKDVLGLVHSVVPGDDEDLMNASNALAREWIQSCKVRTIGPLAKVASDDVVKEFKRINENESIDLADAFLGSDFLEGQRAFLSSKGKTGPAMVFTFLQATRPVWGSLLPPKGTGKM